MVTVIKRDGRTESYDEDKLKRSIQVCLDDSSDTFTHVQKLIADKSSISASDLYELVLTALKEVDVDAAQKFADFRHNRNVVRDASSHLFQQFDQIAGADSKDVGFKRENANINADAPMGAMLKYGSESAKVYNLRNIVRPEHAKLHSDGYIHIHDLDFLSLTFNCVTPNTKVVLLKDKKEQQVSIIDEFGLLGKGTHQVDGVKILSRNGFVSLDYIHVREVDEVIYRFSTQYRSLECTSKHVLPVIRDGVELELEAKDIKQTDKLIVVHNRYSWVDPECKDTGDIVKIELNHYTGKVYDLTTEDHFFVANSLLSHNCCFIPLAKLLKSGFSTGHGYVRQPNDIQSATALACIALQSNQNDMYGGQAYATWDYDLAPYVVKTFIKNLRLVADIASVELSSDLETLCWTRYEDKGTLINDIDFLLSLGVTYNIYNKALALTDKGTHQAMQACIANLNTMQSRAGAQTPFSSINYGTDTSPEGRMVIKATLDETEAGLGDGETPIFPVQIFKTSNKANLHKGTANYDLYQLALRVSAKRLYPNFTHTDVSYNKQYYIEGHPETEIAVMGCAAGNESIVYRYNNTIYESSFVEAWKHLSSLGFDINETPRSVYIKLKDVEILDRDKFVVCKGILKNTAVDNWVEVKTNTHTLLLTDDHPLRVNNDRVMVRDINPNDTVYVR